MMYLEGRKERIIIIIITIIINKQKSDHAKLSTEFQNFYLSCVILFHVCVAVLKT